MYTFERCTWCLKQSKPALKLGMLIWNNKGSWSVDSIINLKE